MNDSRQSLPAKEDRALFQSFLEKPSSKNELKNLIDVLFTDQEISTFANRIRILNLLQQGESQHSIAQKLNVGVATVTHAHQVSKQSAFQQLKSWWA